MENPYFEGNSVSPLYARCCRTTVAPRALFRYHSYSPKRTMCDDVIYRAQTSIHSAQQRESNLYECPSCCRDCAQLQRCKISNCLLTLHFSSVVNQNTQPFISFQRCATHLKIARWLAYVVKYQKEFR